MSGSKFTLYLFGGSVPWGFPYAPKCDIGQILSHHWSGGVGSAELVLRNEARYGVSSRYLLERVRAVAQRAHPGEPALAFLFSGHNEFLHLQPGRGSHGRGPALVSAEERAAIVRRHRTNLEASIQELHRAGIDVVLSTLPSNLRDWPPSYTVREDGCAEQLERLFSRVTEASRASRPAEATALLEEILNVQPECAQAHFALGRAYLAAGRAAEARQHLVAANDHDGRPIRATSAINQNIRTLAAEHDVRLLDAAASFERQLPIASAETLSSGTTRIRGSTGTSNSQSYSVPSSPI